MNNTKLAHLDKEFSLASNQVYRIYLINKIPTDYNMFEIQIWVEEEFEKFRCLIFPFERL